MTSSQRPLSVGDVIHGFAQGAFGRDHYACVRVEAVGTDWIVARSPDSDDGPSFAAGEQSLRLCQQARDEGHQTPWSEAPSTCPVQDPALSLTDWKACDATG